MSKRSYSLRIENSSIPVLAKLELANTFWTRFVGLQFRRELASDAGLLLIPCSSLHTCFMRFPIDVFMLDKGGVVVGIRRNVAPWRAVLCTKGTTQVLETAVHALEIELGQRLFVSPNI